MVEPTRRQFFPGDAEPGGAEAESRAAASAAECPLCHHHFSGADARFCPFDGETLRPSNTWNPSADPLLGSVIDKRYEVIEVLGEGGMGTVYRVRHAALGRQFALKALRRDLAVDSELSARFIQEAKAAAAVVHAGVVQITDFGTLPSGQPYFVMELLQGQPLSWLLHSGGPLPAARAVRVLLMVAEALAAAHEAGVIHRDLKPDNIQVAEAPGERDLVKVLDFGLAKVAGASRLTRAGMVFGTPHYMSPEQAAGEQVDQRSDIYSLGIVMYEMFTGRVPFEADSYMGVLTKHMYVEPMRPSELVSDNKSLGALEDILLRCLEKKPAQRFASMAELIAALTSVVSFSESGVLELRPAASREGTHSIRLADQLEAPTREEMRALGQVRQGRGLGKPAAVALAALGLLLALFWIGKAWFKKPAAPAIGAISAPTARGVASAPRAAELEAPRWEGPAAAGPGSTRTPDREEPGEPSAEAQESPPPSAERAQRGRRTVRPGRNKKANARSLEGSEIIDPWAQ
ncbi:MAG TPA: protein kinase [Polyangiaceae bacterium]|nr:protein kinase [Polyangiaceae bacterium]